MSLLPINGAQLYHEITGSGPETIVFGHSLLLHLRMYDEQVRYFQDRYRCITMDFRGQGNSEITEEGYDMDSLTEDMAALIRELDAGPCHYVGLSMGGFVGQRLAIRYPELLRSLCLLDTTSLAEDPANLPRYRMLLWAAKTFGTWIVAGNVTRIMFGKTFLKSPRRKEDRRYWKKQIASYDKKGLVPAIEGVFSREEVPETELARIRTPTLILVGEEDQALPVAKSEHLHRQIPGSEMHILPEAGHIITVEAPDRTNRLLDEFISRHS